jgi:hypothetical protein
VFALCFAHSSDGAGLPGTRQAQTPSARPSGEAVRSKPSTSLNGFRSALVRDSVSPTTSNADSYFELNKRQAHLDSLRRSVGPNPDPAVKADLENFQRRLDANRTMLDQRAKIADHQVNELMRAGNALYDAGAAALNIGTGNGQIRDYLTVAGAIPVATVVGRVAKIGNFGKVGSITEEVVQLGGAHRVVRKLRGYHSHHMPAKSVSPLSHGDGPSIAMLPPDHKVTISFGRGADAILHRKAQADLIAKGDFHGAQGLDIADIRKKFGSRYDRAIEGMIKYSIDMGK